MSSADLDEAGAPVARYVPSGRVNLLVFLPLMVVGALIAAVMACFLLIAESGFYYYFITPLILGLPVFGATWAIVRWGRCRHRGLGGLAGIVLVFIYYAGYWELSYLANIVIRGPRMVAAAAQIGGLPGLPGYIVFRCKTSRPVDAQRPAAKPAPPTSLDAIFNGIFFGVETFALALGGIALGRQAASRVYFERSGRWASKFEFRLPLATMQVVLDAIERGEWTALAELPRVSSQANANTKSLLFRVEYLPGAADEPAYVSLTGSPGGKAQSLVPQRAISPAQLQALAREFPDLKVPARQPAEVAESASPLEASLQRLGLATPAEPSLDRSSTPDQGDFRDRAVAASRERLRQFSSTDFRTIGTSLCLPASGSDGAGELKRAGWRKAILQGVLFVGAFGGLGVGLIGTQLKDQQGKNTPQGTQLMVIGIVTFFSLAIPALFVAAGGDRVGKPFLAHRLRSRPDSLLNEETGLQSRVVRIEDARTYHKTKLAGEDLGIALLDPENRRILLEGLSHRYVIRGEDVTCFWPLQAHAIISVRIDYQIGEGRLALVFATTNPSFHVLSGMFADRAVKRFVSSLAETLRCEPRTEGEGPPADIAP
jgi:hypothetical protein